MKQENQRYAGPAARAACLAGALLVAVADGAGAQALQLPVPEVTLSTQSRRTELFWNEIPNNVGRSVSDLSFLYTVRDSIMPDGMGGFDTSDVDVDSPVGFDALAPTITFTGEYIVDCDYFLRITKEPAAGFDDPTRIPPRDVRAVLKYQLWTNTQDIGGPAFQDTLNIRQADTEVTLSPDGVGTLGLGLIVGSNIDQPSTTLGSIPITISGLNTGLSPLKTFLVTAESPGGLTGGTGSLRFRVRGPFDAGSSIPPTAADSTMTVTAANTPIKIMNGMFISFGNGSAAPGDSVRWTARHLFPAGSKIEADLEAFEGYHVWRSSLPTVESGFALVGEIRQCDSKESFVLQDPALNPTEFSQINFDLFYNPNDRTFRLVDLDVHDDFPYRYAVSTFDRRFLGNLQNVTDEGELAMTGKIYPAAQQRSPSREVFAVPNPYKRRAAWEENQGKIVFANLPDVCSIRIYTVAADHVATIQHGPGQPLSTSPTSTSWNLVSDGGESIVPGIYIFYVESPDGFRQSGKLIIAR